MKPTNISKIEPQFSHVRQWFDENLDAEKCDLNDQRVYENVFHKGKWAAIFQATERGMQNLLQKAKPRSITDLAALTSIYRPGPLAAGVDKAYVADKEREERGEKLEYLHPVLEKVLGPTRGHMCFQEQFMLLGYHFGLNWDDCDKLRKILVKKSIGTDVNEKKRQEALRIKEEFKRGAMEKGLTEKQVDELWEKMEYFSGYGFNLCLTDDNTVEVYSGGSVVTTPISHVKCGDRIRSRDEAIASDLLVDVVGVHHNGMRLVSRYTLEDGSVVTCTPDHKFRTSCGLMLPMHEIVTRDLDVIVDVSSDDVV